MSRRTDSPLLWLPSASTGVSVTPNASANAFSNWTEISSSLAADIYLAYVMCLPNNGNSGADRRIEFDIGTGTAGNEVVVARTMAMWGLGLQYGARSSCALQLVKRIAAGSRVSLRLSQDVADVDVCSVALGYYDDLGGNTNETTNVHLVTPATSSGTSVSHTGAWTHGSWVQMIATLAADTYLLSFTVKDCTTNIEIQFGLGAASSEVPFVTIPWTANEGLGCVSYTFRYPIRLPAGARLAVRSEGSGTDTWSCSILTVAA